MERIDKFLSSLGFKRSSVTKIPLKNGLLVDRFIIQIGHVPLGFVMIDCRNRQLYGEFLNELEHLSQFEGVILQFDKTTEEIRKNLKSKRIGYFDKLDNFYLPLDICATNSESNLKFHQGEKRSTSSINEFYIGYIFYRNDGYIKLSQNEIGSMIGKSATTVNFLLKNMETEEVIIREGTNQYALVNPKRYFDRWRMLVKNFQQKNLVGKYSYQKEINLEVKLKKLEAEVSGVAFSGGYVDAITNGYLSGSNNLNIYTKYKNVQEIINILGLVSDDRGDVCIFESSINLNSRDGFVHDSLISADLINSKNPRMIEAGEERLAKFISESSRRAYEKNSEGNS